MGGRAREPVLANDALTDERAMQIPGTPDDPEALVVVPLVADGDVIGCMNISRIGGQEIYFSDADFELVELFAGQASIALRNADAHQGDCRRAETDALTGLGNHGAFQRTLAEVAGQPEAGTEADRRRATPPPGPVALLMMDLDNFKAYNDRLGHPAGDALLHAIGAAIYGSARGEDRVFRYGGDEFAVLLPDVDARRPRRSASACANRGAAHRQGSRAGDDHRRRGRLPAGCGGQERPDRGRRHRPVPRQTIRRGSRGPRRRGAERDARPAQHAGPAGAAALLHPDDAPTVDSLVEQATLLSHATEHGQDTVRGALLGVARSLDALDPVAIGQGERVGRLAGLVARKLGCDEGAADTVELRRALQGLEGVGADELEPIPSLREVGEIVRWHRGGGPLERAPLGAQVLAVANAYDRWWRLQMGRMPSAAQQSTSCTPRPGSASVRMWCTRWPPSSASSSAAQPSHWRRSDRSPRSGLISGRDAMIAPPYVEPPPRRRAPGSNPSGLRDAHAGGGTDGLRHDHAQLFSQRSRQPVANERGGQPIGPAQPGATDAAAHADLHQPPDPELAGLIPTRACAGRRCGCRRPASSP